jgi:membrane associated rhomboid family serine protease
MDTISIFLAKFWGWYLIIFFLILSLNPKRIQQIINDLKDQKFVIITSFIAIIVGLLNILFHNIWQDSWILIITLIGWISLLIGLALFIFPERTINWIRIINIKFIQILYMLLFLIGIFLLNMAYGIVMY